MNAQKFDLKLILAFAGVAILWGTTYLGIRIAVETIPGWYVTTVRQSLAALILLPIILYKGELKWHGFSYLMRQILLAILMIVVANGFTTLAEQTIPSGLTALVNSLSPILVFLGSVALGYQKPNWKGFFGVLIGFLGVVFLFRNGVSGLLEPSYRTGVIYLVLANTGWAIGTIYTRQSHQQSKSIFVDLFYQFVISAFIQFVLARIFYGPADLQAWSTESMLAAAYLGIFGSVLGFFCYSYALRRVSASEVSILTYFNTVIAIFLGWLILNEAIDKDIIVAAVLIISGVFITNYKKNK